MNRWKIDSQRERRVLIALVTSRSFLAQASRTLDLELLEANHFRTVAGWCLDYYDEYGKAPGQHVEDLYHRWSEDNPNTELVQAVKDFLETLGEEYEREGDVNVPYLLDELKALLTKRKIQRLKDSIEYSLSTGRLEEAEQSLTEYKRIEVGGAAGLDPMRDREAWQRAFADPVAPIISFEGDAGRFFNPALTRDALVGIQAPEKTGKTWWCIEFVIRALRQRRRVALFEVGDLSESQILRRLGVRWSGRPMWPSQCRTTIMVPDGVVFQEDEDGPGYNLSCSEKRVRKPMTRTSVVEGLRKFRRAFGLSDTSSYLRTSVHPSGTISVKGISDLLEAWAQEQDFVADVVIIDYADILAPESAKKQFRDEVNDTWKALRCLSQQRHALVIVPTQANAQAYELGERLQSMRNFSEDKRKLAHCTAMLALNQSPEEKEFGGMRLNWIVLREAPYRTRAPLYVGTCFALGRAMCCARYPGAKED